MSPFELILVQYVNYDHILFLTKNVEHTYIYVNEIFNFHMRFWPPQSTHSPPQRTTWTQIIIRRSFFQDHPNLFSKGLSPFHLCKYEKVSYIETTRCFMKSQQRSIFYMAKKSIFFIKERFTPFYTFHQQWTMLQNILHVECLKTNTSLFRKVLPRFLLFPLL